MFHLVFLRVLVARGEDKGLIALKGGCNLRFYFGSVRYSDDMDLDVVVIARETLKNKVERLLRSPAVTAPLKAHGLTIVETSAPQQTETTQRWKVGLGRERDELRILTKVEFSRRDAIEGTTFEAADREVLRPYGRRSCQRRRFETVFVAWRAGWVTLACRSQVRRPPRHRAFARQRAYEPFAAARLAHGQAFKSGTSSARFGTTRAAPLFVPSRSSPVARSNVSEIVTTPCSRSIARHFQRTLLAVA